MDTATIMIVEDNTTVAEDARDCLESLGYGVTSIVASGEEAIATAEKEQPDAILMDIKLRGDMDGIEAAEQIHGRFGIPVLFLSAYSDSDLLGRAKKAGSFGYLVKPFEERELYAMLEMTLYKARADKERREMESRLARSRKMAAIGRMAAGIAHHFNNSLYAIIGNLEMAREDLPPGSNVLGFITEAEQSARRASELSRLMLTYLGQSRMETKSIDLSKTVGSALEAIRKEVPPETTLVDHLPDAGPEISADPVQMKQVVRAIMDNAWQAVEGKTPARVTVSVETTRPPAIEERHRFPADWEGEAPTYACLTVSDTGNGMDEETIEAIFDPFFADNSTGRGLGLPMVLGIVRAHGGCITVESDSGRGSAFRVFLPLASEPATPPGDGQPTRRERASLEGTILLVEDEKMVRDLAGTMLERFGFDVISAGDGFEAIERFRRDPDRIRLLLCDLGLPGMDGWEILAKIRGIRPDIPAILISGYDRSEAMAGSHPEQPQAFLQKPFKKNALKETIEQVLAR